MAEEASVIDLDFSVLGAGKPVSAVKGFRGETLPHLFLERCYRTPDKVAFRTKDLGIYQDVTWREYREHVEKCCLGLVELGLKKGDRLALMSDPCHEWLYLDLASLCAGGISYGIYPTCPPVEVLHHMEDGGANFFFAEDQEFVDKILAVIDELPDLRYIIVADTRALFAYEDPRIISVKQLEEIGVKVRERSPGLFEDLISKVQPDDIATFCYTSGTTGKAKGAIQTHRQYIYGWFSMLACHPIYMDEKTTAIAYMPFAHLLGRQLGGYLPIVAGWTMHFGESVEAMQETLWEVAPTLFYGAPRTFEKLAAQVLVGIETSSGIKKTTYRIAMAIARRYIRHTWEGKVPLRLRFLYWIARQIAFRPILNRLGFLNCKLSLISAAPVPTEIVKLWQMWGLNLIEGYGMTEAGNISFQREDFPRPGDTGTPDLGYEIRVTADGEVMVRSAASMAGYWQNPQATAKMFTGDNWILTGDLAQIKEGYKIALYDRSKDIIVSSGGKNISPSELEKAMKASPYISEVIVFGHGRKYPVALIEIDFDTVSEWARSAGILYTSFTSLATHPKVQQLIATEMERGNKEFARVEQVKKFRIMPKELNPDEEADPITPTRKVQRVQMYEKFKDLVESMYSKEEEAAVSAEVVDIKE